MKKFIVLAILLLLCVCINGQNYKNEYGIKELKSFVAYCDSISNSLAEYRAKKDNDRRETERLYNDIRQGKFHDKKYGCEGSIYLLYYKTAFDALRHNGPELGIYGYPICICCYEEFDALGKEMYQKLVEKRKKNWENSEEYKLRQKELKQWNKIRNKEKQNTKKEEKARREKLFQQFLDE